VSELITSNSNSKVKLVRALQSRRRNRESEEAFVAEGVRLVEEAVSVQSPMDFVLYDETLSDRGHNLISELEANSKVDIAQITPELMQEISNTETPQGILGVFKRQALSLPSNPTFVIIADQIRDPGNMGTLLRTAEAAGADAVLLTPGTVDAFSPKVVRAGMGAHFHLPIHHKTWPEIEAYLSGMPVFLTTAEGGILLWEANFRQTCALLIGGEAFGATQAGENLAKNTVTIPMHGRVESLNAAIAAGIVIAEVLRQRYTQKRD
jgi:TrmH family RNA methyltransferase